MAGVGFLLVCGREDLVAQAWRWPEVRDDLDERGQRRLSEVEGGECAQRVVEARAFAGGLRAVGVLERTGARRPPGEGIRLVADAVEDGRRRRELERHSGSVGSVADEVLGSVEDRRELREL